LDRLNTFKYAKISLNKKIILSLGLFILFFSLQAQASVVSVVSKNPKVKNGSIFVTSVTIDTERNQINTVEGDLVYDESVIVPDKILVGESFISFWVEKPQNTKSGIIHFSGIVPGGVSLVSGNLFDVHFKSVKLGSTDISLSSLQVLLNDGEGTSDKVIVKNSKVEVTLDAPETDTVLVDKGIPLSFDILRARSPYIEDNKWFIAFSAQDKGSGVSYYRVCELFVSDCVEAESPYVLKNQTMFFYVKVQAFDVAGNTSSSHLISLPLKIAFMGIFLLIFIVILFYTYRFFKKNRV
jgi:hypothetical protein